jgi:hypothetical protein
MMLDFHNSTLLHGKVSGGVTVLYDAVLGWGVSFKLAVGGEESNNRPLVPVCAIYGEVPEVVHLGCWAKAGCTLQVVGSLADEGLGLGLFVLASHIGVHDGEWLVKHPVRNPDWV